MSDLIGRTTAGNKTAMTANNAAPCTGIAAGARILTLDGALPVEYLEQGDRVITRSGMRVLRAISLRVCDADTVMQVEAGALGFDRPEGTICVGADQDILVRDWRAKALFGRKEATVPVATLNDGRYVTAQKKIGLRLYALSFDTPEVIYAEGMELAMSPVTVAA